MKKQALAALAILGATMGMGAVPQTVPTNQGQNQRHNEGVDKQIMPLRRGPVTALNPSGLVGEHYIAPANRTPKQYGQWLQSTGRQKWIKKAK